jgi:SAM-dependent methyltransferase
MCFAEKSEIERRPGSAPFSYPASTYNCRSASRIVPRLIELFNPTSVVDVGCGLGTWLAVFREQGVEKLLGIDRSRPEEFLLEADNFLAADLSSGLDWQTTFDLAVSLEVAEHLPPHDADRFLDSLCRLAPVIIFSAAIPDQGGDGHQNEQWPAYWWHKIAARGFVGSDALRWEFWDDQQVDWWYRQNLMVFSRDAHVLEGLSRANRGPVAVVHPECLKLRCRLMDSALQSASSTKSSLLERIRRRTHSIARRQWFVP